MIDQVEMLASSSDSLECTKVDIQTRRERTKDCVNLWSDDLRILLICF